MPKADPGCHFEARINEWWAVPAVGAGRCRWMEGRHACGAKPVASLERGYTRRSWWDYCERHLYGGWIEDGRVMFWRMVADD